MGLIPFTTRERRHRIGTQEYVILVPYRYAYLDWNVWAEPSSRTITVCFRSCLDSSPYKDQNGVLCLLPPKEKYCVRTDPIDVPERAIFSSMEDMEVEYVHWGETASALKKLGRENLDSQYLQRLEFKFRIADEFDVSLDGEDDEAIYSQSSTDSSDSSMIYNSDEEYGEALVRTSESDLADEMYGLEEFAGKELVINKDSDDEDEGDEEGSSGGPEDDLEMTMLWERQQLLTEKENNNKRSPSPELEPTTPKRKLLPVDYNDATQKLYRGDASRWAAINNAMRSSGHIGGGYYDQDIDDDDDYDLLYDGEEAGNEEFAGSNDDPDIIPAASPDPPRTSLFLSNHEEEELNRELGLLAAEALQMGESDTENEPEEALGDQNGQESAREQRTDDVLHVDPELFDWSEGIVGD